MKLSRRLFSVILFVMLITLTANAEVKPKNIKSADVVSMPRDNTVQIGETINLEGLSVKIVFEDGEEYIATSSDFTVDEFDNTIEGSQLVTIRYGLYPVTINVTVKKGTLVRLGVEVKSKQRYVGDSISKEGCKTVKSLRCNGYPEPPS